MKLPFGEVKRDIKAGYNYREYDALWYGGKITVIYDGPNEEVIYDFTHFDEEDPCKEMRYFRLPVDDFMQAKYKEITERASYMLFV